MHTPLRASLKGLPYIDALPGDDPWPARALDAMVQIKLVGDPYTGGFAQGHTMRASPSNDAFSFHSQTVDTNAEGWTTVRTSLRNADGVELNHYLSGRPEGAGAVKVWTSVANNGPRPIALEMLSSFSLGGITPFASDDAPGRLRAHRFRSAWSAEGRLETQSLEALHLERSWSGAGAFSERFGQIGSMPARKWFPFAAIEDVAAEVCWGAQLAWAGSWQMEIFRQHDEVALSGGLADREFGHWLKRLEPEEQLAAPPAWISCVAGGLDELCAALQSEQEAAAAGSTNPDEEALPIVFNEWCATWGEPTHDRMIALADSLRGTPVRYLVIDAGWYKVDGGSWNSGHGDWRPNGRLFPLGLEATARAIRQRGLIPGLWFELETVGSTSDAFNRTDLMLQRDGIPITVRERRFWDFRKSEAVQYLSEHVIDLLESGGFGYLKIDYNETIGIGVDGACSLGEGLRQHIEGVMRFLATIRSRLPQLVIENCSSGGHRLEPSMVFGTDMSSFSDAHELVEIPIIAANLHRLVPPRRSQIWAVLHRTDTTRRIAYSLAATLLGRMCLSGEFESLEAAQRAVVLRGMAFYQQASPVIKRGRSVRCGEMSESWRHPQGWQAVTRYQQGDHGRALLVAHFFENAPERATIPLDGSGWRVEAAFGTEAYRLDERGALITLNKEADFSAAAFILVRS